MFKCIEVIWRKHKETLPEKKERKPLVKFTIRILFTRILNHMEQHNVMLIIIRHNDVWKS